MTFQVSSFFSGKRKVNYNPATRNRGSTQGNRSDFSHARKAMTTQTLSQTVYGLRITKQTSSETECPFQCHFNSAILRYQCHCSNCMLAYFTQTHIETLCIKSMHHCGGEWMALIYHYINASYSSQGLLLREISKAKKWFLAPEDGYCEKHPHKKVSRAHRCVHETHKHLCARDDGHSPCCESLRRTATEVRRNPRQHREDASFIFEVARVFHMSNTISFILNVLRQERNCGGVTSQVLLLLVSVNKEIRRPV